MTEAYLYEFLYRGRPPGSAEAPAWHVVIGQNVTLPGSSESQFVSSGALTPAQAEAAGFPLPTILTSIDAAAMASRDAALADAAKARQERDEALAQVQELRDQIATLTASAAATEETA